MFGGCVNVSDQRGTVLRNIYNKDGNEQYKFYYHDPQDSMFYSVQLCVADTWVPNGDTCTASVRN